ncbi:hypothetical protein KKF84_05270, partial [Myxococcota bacterium]|nr:hypothetical protein [Myxococcota bacterium]
MIYPLYYIIPAVLTVLALYSLGHYNLYRLLSPLLGKKPWQRRLFIGVAIFLWSSPFTVALLSRLTIPALTPAIAMTGYVWLGFFIILTVLSMVFHLGVLLVWLLNRARRGKKPLRLPHVQRALP